MFIIEGMDKVTEVSKKNRERKLTKHKKLSNNTLIEIDHCSPKVCKEFTLYAFGRNINKYHRFLHGQISKYKGKTEQDAA